jgi:hypothetical protein
MTQKLESAMTERDASYGLRYLQEASKAAASVDSFARAKADATELHQRGFMSASAMASTVAGIERQQVEAEVQKESRTRVLHDYVEGLAKGYGPDVYVDFMRMGDSVGGDFGTQFANEMAFLSMTIEGEQQQQSIEEPRSELATDPNFNAELFREFMDPESADHQSLMNEWVGYAYEEGPGETFEDFARAMATRDVEQAQIHHESPDNGMSL